MIVLGASFFAFGCAEQSELADSEGEANSGGNTQWGQMIDLSSGETLPPSAGFSMLTRDLENNKLDFELKAYATPGDVYTLWLCGFNNPDACAENPCTGAELVGGVGDSYCQWGAGQIARSDGTLHFEGSSALTTEVILGAGATNIATSEIHFVLRTHGAPIMSELGAMMTTFNGGCPPNTCTDEQASVILKPY